MSEMTCNQFVRAMADAGFSFTYRATNGDVVINGEVKSNGESTAVKSKSATQSRQEIKDMFKQKGDLK
jgi:hypothetical protein